MSEAPDLRVLQGGTDPANDDAKRRAGFVPVVPLAEEPFFSGSLGLGLSLAAAVFVGLVYLSTRPPAPPAPEAEVIEFVVIENEPEPEPEPEPPPKPKVIDIAAVQPVATDTAAEPLPKDAPPPKPVFGVSMNSTVEGNSGLSVRVGNTIGVKPSDEVVAPEDVQPLRQVSFSKLEEPPKLLKDFQYSQSDYPAELMAEGVQGTVVLKLTIDETGAVSKVKVIRGVHPELDKLSMAACRKFKFKPGMSGGEPVVTTGFIYRYNWVIVE